MARCLVLTGSAIAAWMVASGVASASELASETVQAPPDTSADLTGSLEVAAPPVDLAPIGEVSVELAPAGGPLDEPAPPAAEVPVVPGELASVIGNPAGPPQLPGLDRLPPLAGLPALDERPFLGEDPNLPPAGGAAVQRPEQHEPATATGPATAAHAAPPVATMHEGADVHLAAAALPVGPRPSPVDPTDQPNRPAGLPDTDWPCPASPGHSAPTQTAGPTCASEPAGLACDTTPRERLGPAPHGPAEPRLIAHQPGTTPD